MEHAADGERNHVLVAAAFSLKSLVNAGTLDEFSVTDALTDAARTAGLDEGEIAPTIRSGFRGADAKVGARTVSERPLVSLPQPSLEGRPTPGAKGRTLKLKSFADVGDRMPGWAWTYGGHGRIQLGTLTIFAGRPGAGKSTAARWFAARITRGELEGAWYGKPQNVALITPEESVEFAVKPSLRAAGAGMGRVFYPEVTAGGEAASLMAREDEAALTEALIDADIRVLVVDPIMSTLGASVDINRNNEVRNYLQPYSRIAERISGVVVGVAHLKKGAEDVVAGITGSSAFGEVARSVFGFAKDRDSPDERIMSQAKNSAGREDLSIIYTLESAYVDTDDGGSSECAVFKMARDSMITVEDMLADGGGVHTKIQAAVTWLSDYLMLEGPTPFKQIKIDATKEGFSESALQRASRILRVWKENRSIDGAPRISVWVLPAWRQAEQANQVKATP